MPEGEEHRLWWRKTETARRARQGIEAVLDWAHSRGYREGENPARYDGNLEFSLPKKHLRAAAACPRDVKTV